MLQSQRILLVAGGGIAVYKCLDLVRRLRERGAAVRVLMTDGAQRFVTPLAFAALSGRKVATDLFDPAEEPGAGHIALARDCDLVIVAPATANLLARMAHGLADDLAAAVLLATTRPILLAPAMNPTMWEAAPTQENLRRLVERGHAAVGPNVGAMAEAESGAGRMAEPLEIVAAAEALLGGPVALPPPAADAAGGAAQHDEAAVEGPLAGVHVLVTSGPTHEAIDPVRYLANRSSGKQGHAIAAAAAAAGARVTLVSGPVSLPDLPDVTTVHVESAREMLRAVESSLPAEVFVACAAVADWRTAGTAEQKIKKVPGSRGPTLALVENPDILASVARRRTGRPRLVVGFAAETEQVVENAVAKRGRKGCDWIVANDVSPGTGVMGADDTVVHLVTGAGVEDWPRAGKDAVARALVERIGAALQA